MGVNGLCKLLKKSPHTVVGSLKEHQVVHVDMLSTFYGLIQSQSFNIFTKSLRKKHPEEAMEQPGQHTTRKREAPSSQPASSKKRHLSGSGDDTPAESKLIQTAQALASDGDTSCYLDVSGCRLTDQPPQENGVSRQTIPFDCFKR